MAIFNKFAYVYNCLKMKSKEEVLVRLNEIQKDVAVLEEQTQAELNKAWLNRNMRLLMFLRREQDILRFGMIQLEWMVAVNEKDLS
jgi:hypothetical protein